MESCGSRLCKSMAIESTEELRRLLRDFVKGEKREVSFRAIAGHLSGLIYHAAYRQSGDVTLSEEVVQNVLVKVSGKAGKLVKHPEILAWVHEATRLEVLQMWRGQVRRKKREEMAMKEMSVEPVSQKHVLADLDESLRCLDSSERELVLMRFFEGQTFPAIARVTGRSETAEKKRLKRALEKMAGWFGQKGVALSVAGLTTVLSTEMGKAAPVGLDLVWSGGELAAVGSVGVGSGMVAVGGALLLAAGMVVPLLSSWGEVRELEDRLGKMNRIEVTSSGRSGAMMRMVEEEMTVDEVVEMAIRVEMFSNVFQNELLKRQLGGLELEELVEVATRLHSRMGSADRWVLKELRKRLEPMIPQERLEFLIPLRISIVAAVSEFRDWAEDVSLDEAGAWLRENQGFLEKHMWGYALQRDLKGKMWRVYLEELAKVKVDDGVLALRDAPLSRAQKAKWLNDLANQIGERGFKKNEELIIREYRSDEGGLQDVWGKMIVRLIGDDLENFGEWMTQHQFETDERRGLFMGVLRNLHPDLKKKGFAHRLAWLQRRERP